MHKRFRRTPINFCDVYPLLTFRRAVCYAITEVYSQNIIKNNITQTYVSSQNIRREAEKISELNTFPDQLVLLLRIMLHPDTSTGHLSISSLKSMAN